MRKHYHAYYSRSESCCLEVLMQSNIPLRATWWSINETLIARARLNIVALKEQTWFSTLHTILHKMVKKAHARWNVEYILVQKIRLKEENSCCFCWKRSRLLLALSHTILSSLFSRRKSCLRSRREKRTSKKQCEGRDRVLRLSFPPSFVGAKNCVPGSQPDPQTILT